MYIYQHILTSRNIEVFPKYNKYFSLNSQNIFKYIVIKHKYSL